MTWPIRDAQPDDHEALRDLYRRSSLSNPGDRALLLAHPEVLDLVMPGTGEGRMRVAVTDVDEIVGFATALPGDGSTELEALFVDPDWMGRGVGRALVLDVLQHAAHHGVPLVEVTANAHAETFYARLGFLEVGIVDTPLGVPAHRLRRSVEP